MQKGLSTISVALMLLLAISCSEDDPRPVINQASPYYPMKVGRFADYSVEKIQYNELSANDTLHYQMRELLAEETTTIAGEEAFTLQQYTREDENEAWLLDSVYVVFFDRGRLIRQESGNAYVRLVNPISSGQTWNGNVLNGKGLEEYKAVDVGAQFTVNDSLFENTVTVLHNEDSIPTIRKNIRYEVYAENVGMLYQYISVANFFQIADSVPGFFPDSIQNGIFMEKRITGYGVQQQ